MICLELQFPPLPQLLTVGHSVWKPGASHLRRNFAVYDLIFVKKGTFFICEEGREYELGEGELIVLEPNKTHWGHRPVETETEMYWVHFLHSPPIRRVEQEDIVWTGPVERGTDFTVEPIRQSMYVPKATAVEPGTIVPLLDEMARQHRTLTLKSALKLQARLGELLVRLQPAPGKPGSARTFRLCERVAGYLRDRRAEPFDAERMERELHYSFDYLSRCLKQYTGLSPLQYLHRLQIEEAKTLLRRTELSVQAVGERVGQPDGTYFGRLFRRHVGVSPSAYRSAEVSLDDSGNGS